MCKLRAVMISALALGASAANGEGFEHKLVAPDFAANDEFGYSVALDGDTLAVGSWFDDGAGGVNQGSVYVYVRNGQTWSLQAKLTAHDAADGDNFGVAVDLDGDTLVVGAYFDDNNGAGFGKGSAYVFVRNGTTWTEQAKLTGSDHAFDDFFGVSVAVSGDTVLCGAYTDDGPGGADQGSAYVFVRNGVTWTEQAKLWASDGSTFDNFGYSLDLDGETAVISSFLDSGSAGSYQGSFYVFTRSGSTWTQRAKVLPNDPAAQDFFAISVAIDGDTILAGAIGDDDNGSMSGSAYVFTGGGASWSQQAKIKPADGAALDHFGIWVSLHGNAAAVGAYFDNAPISDQGSVYLFDRAGTAWTQRSRIVASDGAFKDEFGICVALRDDTLAVGAHFEDDGSESNNRGAAYVYALPPVCASCAGDLSGDGRVDGADVPLFVNCLLAAGPCACGDLDGDQRPASGDVADDLAGFVQKLLLDADPACP